MIKIWCDFLERGFLNGEFKELVRDRKIHGATSNPSIFANALTSSHYKDDIETLKQKGLPPKEIYENLALQDIKLASEILYPLYENNPQDGLISIELDPFLCHDIAGSIDEGMRLWRELNAKNVMIKVPATISGYEIMEQLMLRGINVNATLVFTKEQAQHVLKSFKSANTDAQGVISVFVSRFDREIDSRLSPTLRGKYGILNAIDIYLDFLSLNNNPNFRVLFASTGVKEQNEIYKDPGHYVYPLALSDCINTLPLDTLHKIDYEKLSVPISIDSLKQRLLDKSEILDSINMSEVEDKLLKNGLSSFEESFRGILNLFV